MVGAVQPGATERITRRVASACPSSGYSVVGHQGGHGLLAGLGRAAQDRTRVHGRHDAVALPLENLAAPHGDLEAGAEQRLGGCGAQGRERTRPHGRELPVQPMPAGADVADARRLVDATLPLALEAEVLHGVGDVDLRAVDARPIERLVEHPPRSPLNGAPSTSSLSPGCSPTSISHADDGPSPKTVWVAGPYSSQRVQPAASRRSPFRSGRTGIQGVAPDARSPDQPSATRRGGLRSRHRLPRRRVHRAYAGRREAIGGNPGQRAARHGDRRGCTS